MNIWVFWPLHVSLVSLCCQTALIIHFEQAHILGCVVRDISKNHSASIMRVKQSLILSNVSNYLPCTKHHISQALYHNSESCSV